MAVNGGSGVNFGLLESLQGKVGSTFDYETQARKSRLVDLQNQAAENELEVQPEMLQQKLKEGDLSIQSKQNDLAVQPQLLQQQLQGNDLSIQGKKMEQGIKQLEIISNVSGHLRTLGDDNQVNAAYQNFRTQYGNVFPNLPKTMTKNEAETTFNASISAKDRLIEQKARIEASKPMSSAGQIEYDVKRGLLTPQQGETALSGLGTKVTVNNNPELKGNIAEEEAYAKAIVKRYETAQEDAYNAQSMVDKIKVMNSIDTNTGTLAPLQTNVAALAEAVGIDPKTINLDKAGNAQTLNAIAKDLVLQKQLLQKGPQTESDARRLEESTASLSKTPYANKFINQVSLEAFQRQIDYANYLSTWKEEKGTLKGADKAWREHVRETPLISNEKDANGVPVTYYNFKEKFLQRNPNATQEDADNFWRERYSGVPQRKDKTTPDKLSQDTTQTNDQNLTPFKVATQYLGTNEHTSAPVLAGYFRKTLGKDIDPQKVPWCAAFANAVLKESGIDGTNSLAARSFLNFGTPTDKPSQGDIVVLSRGNNPGQGHVGFFAGYDGDGNVKILGGNQNDSVSVKTYPRSKVVGYRKPPTANQLKSIYAQANNATVY